MPCFSIRSLLFLLCWLSMAMPLASAQQTVTAAKAISAPSAIELKKEISNAPSTVIDISGGANNQTVESVVDNNGPKIKLATPVLKAGQVRIKPLSRELDAASRKLVLERIAEISGQPVLEKPVVVFNGAAEMLSADEQKLTLRALALADKPLRYNAVRRVYEGTLSVGVVELDPSGKALELSTPVVFEVLGVVAKPKQVSATTTARFVVRTLRSRIQ